MGVKIIGPVSPPISGPGVKNMILISTLKRLKIEVNVINTLYWKKDLFKVLFGIIFNNSSNVILSTSERGRYICLPILLLKKRLIKNFKFALLPMGGGLYKEAKNLNKLFRAIFVDSLRAADYVFAETKGLAKDLRELTGTDNVVYLPNFKDRADILKQDVPNPMSTFKLLFISRIRKDKGIEISLKAIDKLIKAHNIPISYDVYGPIRDSYKDEFFGVLSRYTFASYKGVIEPEKVSEVISQYHCFLFPTYCKSEGFPGVIIDAYIAGVPVIVTNCSFNAEIVGNNVNGLIAEPEDVDDLADKIKHLYDDQNLLHEIACRNQIEAEKYLADNVITSFVQMLRQKDWSI